MVSVSLTDTSEIVNGAVNAAFIGISTMTPQSATSPITSPAPGSPSPGAVPPASTAGAPALEIDTKKVDFFVYRKWRHRAAVECIRFFLRWWFILWFGLRSHGHRHLPPNRGYILLSNHQSTLDPVVNGILVNKILRFMARHTLFRGFFATLITYLGAFPVTRGRRDEFAFRISEGVVKTHQPLLIYGEGTRSDDGEIKEIRGGIEIIGRRTHAPILPMVIEGDFESLPRGRSMLRLKVVPIHVISGPMIEAEEYAAWPARTMPEKLRERMVAMHARVRQLRAHAGPGITTLTAPMMQMLLVYLRMWVALLERLTGRKFAKPPDSYRPGEPRPSNGDD